MASRSRPSRTWHVDPSRAIALRHRPRRPEPDPGAVDVAPAQADGFADPQATLFDDDKQEPADRARDRVQDGEEVLAARWVRLLPDTLREPHTGIACEPPRTLTAAR